MFKVGDIVYCNKEDLDESDTDFLCGLEDDMKKAESGFPMRVERTKEGGSDIDSYYLSAPQFTQKWWFHANDLSYFNLDLENK